MSFERQRNRKHADLVGTRVGKLTVIAPAEDYVNPKGQRYLQWLCRCDCGKTVVKRGTAIVNGNAKSCGCARKTSLKGKNVKDMTGQRFGRWTVLSRAGSDKSRVALWNCKCDCGNTGIVSGVSLRRGDSLSCGCLKMEHLVIDRNLTGMKFGLLTVIDDDVLAKPDLPRFSGSRRSISKYARHYQFDVVYKRELTLWYENSQYRGSTLREWLYANREKYLGKSREELTSQEILSGFTISGILRGFTTFDTKLMDQIFSKYTIGGLYDPCAGWGERMLLSYIRNIPYYGVDINAELKSGYDLMIQEFSMKHQQFIVADSADMIMPAQYDAVITCPPYHNLEHYSEQGCENLSYKDFLSWWDKVVSNCSNAKLFCFQINQKYKADMQQIVEQHEYHLKEELLFGYAKSSHFMKSSGHDIKKEYESMLVFCKE